MPFRRPALPFNRNRRRLAIAAGAALAALGLGACQERRPMTYASVADSGVDPSVRAHYASFQDDGYTVPAINTRRYNRRFLRQVVSYDGEKQPGSIVVDTPNRFLYFITGNNRAIRYGIGVGRDGFRWGGVAKVGRKAPWPTWTPPKDMIARDPEAAKYASGMPGGVRNPLGARALYLYRNGRDTLFRIHGTNEPSTIGTAVSSGCIRMLNQDVIDLYSRVKTGAKVTVLQNRSVAMADLR
ncbi:MAG: L,D-transpeptidase [Beijerinckiaceae bacterium]